MKIVVLGCGNIGSVIAKDLAESLPTAKIVMADMDKARAEKATSRIGRNNTAWIQVDASDYAALTDALKEFDLAVGALPGSMGFQACKACIAAGVDMVDVSYMPQNVMSLSKTALKADLCIIPDCGMSPGLSNILVGHAVSELDRVDSVHLLNGGLPEKPIPPLGYVITWSVKDLIDMYSRKVTVVKGGRTMQVEAMSGLEEITYPGIGKLEAFYTDGLRTLLHTIRDAKDMWEKTLRYPSHIQKIKLLQDLGFFDETPLVIRNSEIAPREVAAMLFEKKLKMPDVPDIVAMRVETKGIKNGKRVAYVYHLIDRYDKKNKVSAMARTTAYTTSIAAQLLAKNAVEEKGVVPPERLGMNSELFEKFIDRMRKRGIKIKETLLA